MIEPSVSTLLLSVSTAVLSVSSGFDLSNEKQSRTFATWSNFATKYDQRKCKNNELAERLPAIARFLYPLPYYMVNSWWRNRQPITGNGDSRLCRRFLLCMLFTYISLGFSYLVFKILPFRTSYVWVIVYASCLLTLNNLVTFGMTSLFNLLWDETGNGLLDELINMKGLTLLPW